MGGQKKRQEKFETSKGVNQPLLALKMEERGAMCKKAGPCPSNWKWQENSLPWSLLFCQLLDISSVRPDSDS